MPRKGKKAGGIGGQRTFFLQGSPRKGQRPLGKAHLGRKGFNLLPQPVDALFGPEGLPGLEIPFGPLFARKEHRWGKGRGQWSLGPSPLLKGRPVGPLFSWSSAMVFPSTARNTRFMTLPQTSWISFSAAWVWELTVFMD